MYIDEWEFRMYIDEFAKHFGSIEEPRQVAKVSHTLFDIMSVTMCAGADGRKGDSRVR